jgi:hypothetical protein
MAPNPPGIFTTQTMTAPVATVGFATEPERYTSRVLVELGRRGEHRFLVLGPITLSKAPAVPGQARVERDLAALTRKGRREGWRSWWVELVVRGRSFGIYR